MSDTPKLPDECKRLLDNGWLVVLIKSDLGDYAALAIGRGSDDERRLTAAIRRALASIPERQIASDFEPSQALTSLPEKVFGCS